MEYVIWGWMLLPEVSIMLKLLRYSLGVSVGVTTLIKLSGASWELSATVAVAVVAFGWILWGFLSLSSEYQKMAIFAVDFTAGAVDVLFGQKSIEDSDDGGTDLAPEPEEWLLDLQQLPKPERKILVHDRNGTHYITMDEELDTPYRQQVMSFLVLGIRAGGFTFRQLQGRRLSGGQVIEQELWTKITDDLVTAGLFQKGSGSTGTKPRIGTAWDVINRVAGGASLSGEPLTGEILSPTRPPKWS